MLFGKVLKGIVLHGLIVANLSRPEDDCDAVQTLTERQFPRDRLPEQFTDIEKPAFDNRDIQALFTAEVMVERRLCDPDGDADLPYRHCREAVEEK